MSVILKTSIAIGTSTFGPDPKKAVDLDSLDPGIEARLIATDQAEPVPKTPAKAKAPAKAKTGGK